MKRTLICNIKTGIITDVSGPRPYAINQKNVLIENYVNKVIEQIEKEEKGHETN